MSGRQQHYIPQLLQRFFAFRQRGDEFQVYVHRKGAAKPFLANTRGVGQQRDFYGGPESPELDEAITRTETSLAKVLRAVNGDSPGAVPREDIALLIVALSMRTKTVRQALLDLSSGVLGAAKSRIPGEAASRALLQSSFKDGKRIDEAIDRELRNHPEMSRNQRSQFKKVAKDRWTSEFEKNERKYAAEFRESLAQHIEQLSACAAAIGDRAFLQALSRDPSMPERTARFAGFEFSVLDTDAAAPFILGDCVAFATYTDGKARLALADLDDEIRIQRLFLPVSSTRCMVGQARNNEREISVGEINRMSASLSLDLFISNMPECEDTHSLRRLIGTSAPYSTDEGLIQLLSGSEWSSN